MTKEPDFCNVLFLDTEWADDLGRELVSIALVDQAASEFYAERNPLPAGNEFARQVLYPRLLRGDYALSEERLVLALSSFLLRYDNPRVIATHANDFELLDRLLERAEARPVYAPELRFSKSLLECIRVEFARSPDLQTKRHNALIDARVLRSAYLAWQVAWSRQ